MKPFDLEAAKRGEPLQMRNGDPCYFVAFCPEAMAREQLILRDHNNILTTRYADGTIYESRTSASDVLMVPKKVIRYVHFGVHFGGAKGSNEIYAHMLPYISDKFETCIAIHRVEMEEGRFDT